MDFEQLKEDAKIIRNETTPGMNTANRIGGMFLDVIDEMEGISKKLGMFISGKVNITVSSGKITLQNVYNNLPDNGMAYLLITDSNGMLPSTETHVTVEDSVRSLFTTDSSLGANVGDVVLVAKLKVSLINVPVYKIIPLNDAKAASGSFPGSMGLESPWDKKQINLVPTAMQFPTREGWGFNMNECLESGVYPWCTLGRPSESTGAFTLIVKKTTTADGNGFYSVEQTAYGREAELGQVWKRIIFQKAGEETQYGEWIRIDNVDSDVYICPGSFVGIDDNDYNTALEHLGSSLELYNALNEKKVVKDSVGNIITYYTTSHDDSNNTNDISMEYLNIHNKKIYNISIKGLQDGSYGEIQTTSDNIDVPAVNLSGSIIDITSSDKIAQVFGTVNVPELINMFRKNIVRDKSGIIINAKLNLNGTNCIFTYLYNGRAYKLILKAESNFLYLDTYISTKYADIDNEVHKIPGSFNLISNNVGDTSENKVQVGDANLLYNAILDRKIITDGEVVILNVLPASTDYKYALFYTFGGIYYAVYVLFNVSTLNDIIKINGISTLNREVINIVVDNLSSDSTTQPLSAKQGKVLNNKITALTNSVNSISGQFIIHDTTYDVDTSTGIGISQLWNSIINGVSDYRDYISAYNAIFHNTNSNGVHTTFEFIKGVEEMCTIKNSLGDMYLAEMTSGSQVYINKLKRVTTTNEPIS